MWPPMAYPRAIFLVMTVGGSTIDWGSELANILIMMSCVSLCLLIAGIYLHAILPTVDVSGKEWYFPVLDLLKCFRRHGLLVCFQRRRKKLDSHIPLLPNERGPHRNFEAATESGPAADLEAGEDEVLLQGADGEDEDVKRERMNVIR